MRTSIRRDREPTQGALVLLATVAIGLFAGRARADERLIPESRIESARGVALGTGVRAAAASTQAQAENPANLPLASLYHMEGFFSYQPQSKRMGAGASVVDSTTSRVAAGLSARGLFGDNDSGENSGWDGRVSLGMALGEVLSIGLAGRYANFSISDPKARPERAIEAEEAPDKTFKLKGFTMDAALTARPIPALSISLLGYNLINRESLLAPLLLGGGVAFGISGLTVGGDLLVDMNKAQAYAGPKLQAGGGLEYLAQGIAPIRFGYMFDQARHQHMLSGGLGYIDQRFGLQLSLRQSVSGVSETVLFSAVQYFVPQ